MKNKNHPQGDYSKYILMALLKEGPLSLKELEEKTFAPVFHFHGFSYSIHKNLEPLFDFFSRFKYQPPDDNPAKMKETQGKPEEQPDVKSECDDLIENGIIRLNEEEEYELTKKGIEEAERSTKSLEKTSSILESQLNLNSAARNTIIFDLFSAIIKLSAGLFSGSVGLIADGADATMDIASDSVVWISIKFKKQLLGTIIIILMMYITAFSVSYESIIKIIHVITATVQPISVPYLVILIEGVSLIIAGFFYFYQRYVGKSYGSLALISQSFDSKNHVYVGAAVIIGVIFSIFGINFVDALIGAFVASRDFFIRIWTLKRSLPFD